MKLENLKKITFKVYLKSNASLIWKGIQQLLTLKFERKKQSNIITVKCYKKKMLKTL